MIAEMKIKIEEQDMVAEMKFKIEEKGMIEEKNDEDEIEKNPKKLENFNYPVPVFDYKNRAEGVNAPTISAPGSYQGWQEIEITVDSGACDTVMPLSLCSDIPVTSQSNSVAA